MSSLFEVVVSEFECPICLNITEPPIRQCRIGHILCNSCFGKITRCPTCRGLLAFEVSYLHEDLYSELPFPCNFHTDGCEFIGKRDARNMHKKCCPYGPLPCPLYPIYKDKCEWKGPIENMINHCEDNHSDYLRKGSRFSHKLDSIAAIEDKKISFVVQAHGEVFLLCCKVLNDDSMLWCFYLIGAESDLERYEAKITLGTNVKTTFKVSCHIKNYDDLFNMEKCHSEKEETLCSMLKNDNGAFNLEVHIIDRGFELFLQKIG